MHHYTRYYISWASLSVLYSIPSLKSPVGCGVGKTLLNGIPIILHNSWKLLRYISIHSNHCLRWVSTKFIIQAILKYTFYTWNHDIYITYFTVSVLQSYIELTWSFGESSNFQEQSVNFPFVFTASTMIRWGAWWATIISITSRRTRTTAKNENNFWILTMHNSTLLIL